MSGITIENIKKTYNTYIDKGGIFQFRRQYLKVLAVDDISFTVHPGEILGLIGLNGAGKTSIIKMAAGVMKPDSGVIKVMGEDPFARGYNYKRQVSLVLGQSGQLNRDLSILDNVIFIGAIYGLDKNTVLQRMNSMSEILLLTPTDLRKQVRSLSFGQRVKGELLLSFIHHPRIIYLDEPTLGLDIIAQKAIREFLLDYVKLHEASIILTSHYMKDIDELCERAVVINKGECIFYGRINQLKKRVSNIKRIKFSASFTAIQIICKKYSVYQFKNQHHQYYINSNNVEIGDIVEILSNTEGIYSLEFIDDDLEYIIESLYKEHE